MRKLRQAVLLTATIFLSAGVAAASEANPGPESPSAETSSPVGLDRLSELLRALGVDALAVDMFLKIEGIEGEATTRGGHENWIEIESFGWGESRPSGGGRGQVRRMGSTSFTDVSVVKKVDAASPNLYLACASGKHFPSAVLEIRRAGSPEAYFSIHMENVLVTSVSVSHSEGAEEPLEELSLNYGKIRWEYTSQDATGASTGKIERSWDLEANQGG